MKRSILILFLFLLTSATAVNAQDRITNFIYAYYSQCFGYEVTSIENQRLFDCVDLWIGTKYKLSGKDEDGIDCSRFAMMVYNYVYAKPINGNADVLYHETNRESKAYLKQGDLVFFRIGRKRISHVGIYMGDNKFAHSSTSHGIIISDLNEPYWKKYFAGGGTIKY